MFFSLMMHRNSLPGDVFRVRQITFFFIIFQENKLFIDETNISQLIHQREQSITILFCYKSTFNSVNSLLTNMRWWLYLFASLITPWRWEDTESLRVLRRPDSVHRAQKQFRKQSICHFQTSIGHSELFSTLKKPHVHAILILLIPTS